MTEETATLVPKVDDADLPKTAFDSQLSAEDAAKAEKTVMGLLGVPNARDLFRIIPSRHGLSMNFPTMNNLVC